MSWRTINEDDVYSAISATEALALRNALLKDGQADTLTSILGQVTGQVRDAIRSNRDNRLSPTATHVPEGVIPMAVDIILYRLGLRFDRVLPLTDGRKDAKKAAEAMLRDIARGIFAVEQFGADEDQPAPVPLPKFTGRGRDFTRATQDGI